MGGNGLFCWHTTMLILALVASQWAISDQSDNGAAPSAVAGAEVLEVVGKGARALGFDGLFAEDSEQRSGAGSSDSRNAGDSRL